MVCNFVYYLSNRKCKFKAHCSFTKKEHPSSKMGDVFMCEYGVLFFLFEILNDKKKKN